MNRSGYQFEPCLQTYLFVDLENPKMYLFFKKTNTCLLQSDYAIEMK